MATRTSRTVIRILFPILFVILLLMVGAGFVLLLSQGRTNERVLMEFQAFQAASYLTETYTVEGTVEPADIPPDVDGFAIYSPRGDSVVRYGTAPASLDPRSVVGPEGAVSYRGTVIRIVRPVGVAPMQDFPRFEDDMMGPGMRGRRGGFQLPREFMFIEYNVESRIRVARTRDLVLGGFAVLFAGVLGGSYFLFMRLRTMQEATERQRHLVQLGEAARTLTHELKNPLVSIQMQRGILQKQLDAAYHPSLDIIDEEVRRIALLADRVREFLKNPEGNPARVEVCEFIDTTASRMNLPVTLERPEEGAAWVWIDQEHFRSVVENVLRNATEANAEAAGEGPQQSAIEVAVRRSRRSVAISVADRGPGIAQGDRGRIFDPFYTTKTTGNGVGLSISRRFVEAAGGTIAVADRPGGGTIFTIDIPEDEGNANTRG